MFDNPEGPVRVSVGILRKDNTVLLCQRGINHRYGLKWEFPGGKAFPDESPVECLERELEEELGLVPCKMRVLSTIRHIYDDGGDFLLTFFEITEWEGDPTNHVFEKIEWLDLATVETYDLLEGSRAILEYLKSSE
ncbi:MAG: NUDIX domain-containing protein [Chlorobi bacterium]|nr:NUDIX domain-containing protein [Chlorobiota bacterium]